MRIFLFILLLFAGNNLFAGDSKIKVVFRYDDFTLQNVPFQDSLLSIFDSNSIPVSIAVIPYDKTADPKPYNSMTQQQMAYLQELIHKNIVEVAQHGFNHTKNSKSEFKDVKEEKQYALIEKGKKYLDSVLNVNITTFIPPWNQYDSTTLEVLAKLGFKGISADLYGVATSNTIHYMPCTDKYVHDIKDLVSKNRDRDVTLIVMLHDFNFKGDGNEYYIKRKSTLIELKEVLKWLKENNIQCCTFSQLISSGEDFGKERYLVNSKLFDGVISHRFFNFYVPVDYEKYKSWDKAFWAGYYFVALLLLWVVAKLMKIKPQRRIALIFWISCTVVLAAFFIYGRFTHKLLFVINGFGVLWLFASLLLMKSKKMEAAH